MNEVLMAGLQIVGFCRRDSSRRRVWSLQSATAVATPASLLLGALTLVGCSETARLVPPNTEVGESKTVGERVQPQPISSADAEANGERGVDPSASREQRIEMADQMLQAGQFDKAAAMLRQQLLVDPTDVEVLFRLASVSAEAGNLEEGLKFLDAIPADDPEAGLPALGQSADWCVQLKKYDQAERRYREILRLAPNVAIAHRRLGQLLNRQGRRHEAAEHIRELCKQGNIRQDELHALVVLSDAMSSEPTASTDATEDYSPIGASGQARVLFTQRKYAEAAEVLRDALAQDDVAPSVIAFYRRAVAEAQDDEEFLRWLGGLDVDAVSQFSEYWSAIATYLASQQRHASAARAFLEVLDRDPTDFRSINRLHQMLTLLGKPELAQRWEKRWNTNRKVLLANNEISASDTPNVEAMDEIASQLSGLDRAVGSCPVEIARGVPSKAGVGDSRPLEWRTAKAGKRWKQLSRPRSRGFARRNWMPFRFRTWRLSAARPWFTASIARASEPRRGAARLTNVAAKIGLKHTYQVSSEPVESGFAMYHQTGGGVTILDYDIDGNPDLYFAQGAADPPDFVGQQSNLLFRNIDGRVADVTNHANAGDWHYTIGCSAGDWNQDGFPDLVTANIGPNQLLINNGDGTFTASALPGSEDLQRMPASVAIADLNRDALPDLFEVNYIQDSEIARRPDRDDSGRVIEAVGPAGYAPARDRIGINDGSGGIVFDSIGEESTAVFRGLGVVIADFNNSPGNDIFVGNDKSPNQLWVRDPDSQEWLDIAMVTGVAYSFDGGGTASMGIAAGDFDNSGTLDLHIANFQNESACLYLAHSNYFQDRAAQFRLGVPSYEVLGFGSQALDYDNNGSLDLAVTNGHIDDYRTMSGPFRQKSQLFANLGNRFEETKVSDPSGYWATPHLGRAMARLDFNRDGRNDLVVTHLSESSSLLLNETDQSGHWLQLKLIGVESERDAIGAKVTVESGEHQWTAWVTGGDGYLCRNESVVSFGLGIVNSADRVRIEWPSGVKQSLNDVAVDRRILVVENEADWFELDR